MNTSPPRLHIVRDHEVRDTIAPPIAAPVLRVSDEMSAALPAPELLAATTTAAMRVARPRRRRLGRAIGLAALAAIFAASWGASQLYYLATDARIAPVQLAPDSEAIAELQRVRNRSLAELARFDAETARLDGDLAAIDREIGALSRLRRGSQVEPVARGEPARLELELAVERLQGEARGDRARRAAAVAGASEQRSEIAELEAQPLYRAFTSAADIAFVPADQLSGALDARVIVCVWGMFQCRAVGRVLQILPGDVVAADPRGALAHGHYAMLQLDDRTALGARALRIRR